MFGNWMKTTTLMAAIVALFALIGAQIGGSNGMVIALIFAGAMNFWAYWFSDKMVLRMYNAQQVDAASGGRFYAIVSELAERAGLPVPRVYVIDEDQPNAFSTRRNPANAAVSATAGIIPILRESELPRGMALPPAHVKHRPIPSSPIPATNAGPNSAL